MLNLVEMSASIVLKNQSETEKKTPQAIMDEIKKVYTELRAMAVDSLDEEINTLEVGDEGLIKVKKPFVAVEPQFSMQPQRSGEDRRKNVDQYTNMNKMIKERVAIGHDEISCLICGQGGMKVLKQHLTREHHITPSEYKTQFGIPSSTPLVCTSYHNSRSQNAIAKGLGKKHRTEMPMTIGTQKQTKNSTSRTQTTKPYRTGTFGENNETGNGSFTNSPRVIIRKKTKN